MCRHLDIQKSVYGAVMSEWGGEQAETKPKSTVVGETAARAYGVLELHSTQMGGNQRATFIWRWAAEIANKLRANSKIEECFPIFVIAT